MWKLQDVVCVQGFWNVENVNIYVQVEIKIYYVEEIRKSSYMFVVKCIVYINLL